MSIENEYIMSENDFIELENQLSCPSGEFGIELGKLMNESNAKMILNSIDFLDIKDNYSILEIGHGNCGHLDSIMKFADNIRYYGLEISETMWKEAKKLYQYENTEFYLYNGVDIPFPINKFDRILSVNTIYFWENPKELILEIERILKPNGIFVLTFADKEYIENLPYTKNKFKIYDIHKMKELIIGTKLQIIESVNITDKNEFQEANYNERKYSIVKIGR